MPRRLNRTSPPQPLPNCGARCPNRGGSSRLAFSVELQEGVLEPRGLDGQVAYGECGQPLQQWSHVARATAAGGIVDHLNSRDARDVAQVWGVAVKAQFDAATSLGQQRADVFHGDQSSFANDGNPIAYTLHLGKDVR